MAEVRCCQECGVPLGQPHNICCDEVLYGAVVDGALVTAEDCETAEEEATR